MPRCIPTLRCSWIIRIRVRSKRVKFDLISNSLQTHDILSRSFRLCRVNRILTSFTRFKVLIVYRSIVCLSSYDIIVPRVGVSSRHRHRAIFSPTLRFLLQLPSHPPPSHLPTSFLILTSFPFSSGDISSPGIPFYLPLLASFPSLFSPFLSLAHGSVRSARVH